MRKFYFEVEFYYNGRKDSTTMTSFGDNEEKARFILYDFLTRVLRQDIIFAISECGQ